MHYGEHDLNRAREEAPKLSRNLLQERITRLKYQMKQRELYVIYWTAYGLRDIDPRSMSCGDNKLTQVELHSEAFETAKRHIHEVEMLGEMLCIYEARMAITS